MSFIFGGETGQTQDSITDARRRMAIAQLQQGMQSSPIQSPWQGVARLSEALMGGLAFRRQAEQEREANSQVMSAISGQPYTPPAQSPGFLSSLFGNNNVPASGAQGQMSAANPGMQAPSAPQQAQVPPDQIKSLIAQNVPPDMQAYATNLIGHESSFNPNAVSPTGATGLAQFTRGTGKQYGLVGPNGDQRKDPVANLHALVALTNDDRSALTNALGRPPTDGELALAHQQGIGGAISLLSGKNVPAQNLAVNNINPNSDPRAAAAQIMKFYGGAGGPQVASLNPAAGMGQTQQPYHDPAVTTAFQAPIPTPSPGAQAIQQQSPIPGPSGQMPPQDPTQTASIDPTQQSPQAAPPMPAPANIPSQPISNPMPLDRSGVGMGGAAPGPGAFPTAPGDGPARLAAALQGAQQGPQGAPPQQQLAQAMQGQSGGSSPLAGNPRAQALMQAMMNPYASPQARQMAGSMLQMQMAPQLDFVTRPDGSIVAINKLTGQVAGNPVGAMKTDSVIDGPTDPQTGMPTKLIWNAVDGVKGRLGPDGNVQPVGQGQQQAPGALPGAIPQPPPGVDPKKYREEAGNISAHDLLPTAHDEMEFANSVTSRKNYQEYSAAAPTWNSFTQHIQDNTAGSDKAIVDDFAKILNPGRAVTTGGFQLNMDAQGIPELIQGQIMKALNGDGELGPDARAAMARAAQIKMTEYKRAWQTDADQSSKIAKAHHLDPDRVVPQIPDLADIDFGKINSLKTTASGTGPYPGPSAASPAGAQQGGMPTATSPNGAKIQWNGSAWVPLGGGN